MEEGSDEAKEGERRASLRMKHVLVENWPEVVSSSVPHLLPPSPTHDESDPSIMDDTDRENPQTASRSTALSPLRPRKRTYSPYQNNKHESPWITTTVSLV